MRSIVLAVLVSSSLVLVPGCAEAPPNEGPAPVGEREAALSPSGDIGWVGYTGGAIRTQYNSAGGVNTVTHVSTGTYEVTYPSLGGGNGNVQASGGNDNASCHPVSWLASGANEIARIECRLPNGGALVDSDFETLFFRGGTGSKGAYLWAASPTTPSYAPPAGYVWQAYAGSVSVTRSATGTYRATVPNGSSSEGHVQLGAYGTVPSHCKVYGWSTTSGYANIDVRCFDLSTGAPADAMFSLLFTLDTPRNVPGSYAWLAFNSFPPPGFYNAPGAYALGTTTASGIAPVSVTMSQGQGLVLATAQGNANDFCYTRQYSAAPSTLTFQGKCWPATGVAATASSMNLLHLRAP